MLVNVVVSCAAMVVSFCKGNVDRYYIMLRCVLRFGHVYMIRPALGLRIGHILSWVETTNLTAL